MKKVLSIISVLLMFGCKKEGVDNRKLAIGTYIQLKSITLYGPDNKTIAFGPFRIDSMSSNSFNADNANWYWIHSHNSPAQFKFDINDAQVKPVSSSDQSKFANLNY